MTTLQEYRLEAGLSINALSKASGIDRTTIDRAEQGQPVQDVKAYKIVQELAKRLGREIKMSDVEGLNIL